MEKEPKETILQIKFANQEAVLHFASWLCESGEQAYRDWMEGAEGEEDGDNIIRTTCGRLNRNQ